MAVRYPGLLVTLEDGTCMWVPDPMHLEGWEDNDEPLATDWHRWDRDHVESVLRARFAGPDCYVSGETWLHMDPLHPDDKLQPDLLVALGVVHTARAGYNPEVEGKPPDLLAEFLSDSSLKADRSDKWPRYARLGVREYFVFNPGGRFRDPRIQGWTLQRDATRAALPVDWDGGVASRVLPVRFVVRADRLDVVDAHTGRELSVQLDLEHRLTAEQQARQREAETRQRAEEAAQVEATARRRAEEAAQVEAAARQRAEEEIVRLRAMLIERSHGSES